MKRFLTYLLLLLVLGALSSCKTKNLFDTVQSQEFEGELIELLCYDSSYGHILMPDDKLALSIWNHNDLSIGSVFSIYNSNEAFGKWVLIDQRGMAVFPKLGPVKISGLTVKEAEDLLGELYGEVLKEPVLTLKVLNRSVDVVGEVVMPGKVILEKERPTLMEVVGECRGFSGYADIERIEIIRDNVRYTVNLRELSEYHTYGLVMQSGDILHVPSRSGKRLEQSAPVIIPFASVITALSLVATIVLSQ